ncbi:MAG: hypothetical protein ACUVV3_09690 [Dehalococcoidia bacterium]
MTRLRLFGEPEGGGTDDHSALANLDYAHAGHSGFVPSQGEALVDILRLNQNRIRDSGGNDRITLSAVSPHITLASDVQVGGRLGLGAPPSAGIGFVCNPTIQTDQDIKIIAMNPSLGLTGSTRTIYAVQGQAVASVYSGATALEMAGLYFTALASGSGTAQKLYAVWARAGLQSYSGPAPQMWGALFRSPLLFFSTYPSDVVGVEIEDMGYYSASSHNATGLKIADQTAVSGTKYLIEAGPSTPYLRLVGGSDPPNNKSNLYLKFGTTLYRLVKSGSYVTLEAA